MNKRSLLTVLALAAITLPALSHDFWMEPSGYTLEKGALCSVTLKVGDFAIGENVPRAEQRIVDFSVHGPGVDKKLVGRDGGDPAGYVRLESDGLYVLGYHSTNATVELEATKFENYLHERGLDEALAVREQRNEHASAGREQYSRCAKTIVRVGKGGDGKGFDHVLGYTLELLPEKNPFDLKKVEKDGASLVEGVPLRLMYQGKPLANALIGALNLDAPKPKEGEPKQQPITARTDAEGRVKLDLPATGRWLFAAVHMIHLDGNPAADWESYWASLTVEIPSGDAKEPKESKEKDSKEAKEPKKKT